MTPFLTIFLPLLIAYATAIVWCVERWNSANQYFAHGWLVPLVAVVVFWLRRDSWRATPRLPDRRGLWLLVPALLLHFAGAALMIDSWSAASMVLAIPGAAWLALGRRRLRGLWPVLWLGLFAVPMPIYVEGRLAFVLKELAVNGGAWLANVFGADIVRNSAQLQPRGIDGALFVADECGGLRSLLSMITLAYCLACFLGGPSRVRRIVLLAAAPVLAIVANITRIAVLCLLARHFGVPFAEGTGHTLANVAEWVTVVAALLLVDRWLPSGEVPAAVHMEAPPASTSLRTCARWLWLAAVPLLALSLYRPGGVAMSRAAGLPTVLAGYTLMPRTAEQEAEFQTALPRWRELLGTSDFVWRHYRGADDNFINLVAVYHDTNWKSVHPPRICIEASDMDIEVDNVAVAPWLAAGGKAPTVSRIVARSREDGARYVTLSVFGTRDWLSGDYWDFTWYHLPRALLRANMSGFLLRIESPVRDGEAVALAEKRCATFLNALLPVARSALR